MVKLLLGLLIALSTHAAVTFDGTSGQVVHLGPDKFSITGPLGNVTNGLSVSFWVEKRAGNPSGGVYIGWGRVTVGNNDAWAITDASGAFAFEFAAPAGTFHIYTCSSAVLATNVPIHVGFTFTSGTQASAQFYINGVRVAGSWTANAPGATKMVPFSNEPLRIGGTYTGGSNTRTRMSEVAIWWTDLNDADFTVLGKARIRGVPMQIRRDPDRLALYVPMDSDFVFGPTISGTNRIRDFGPNSYHMTPLASPKQSPPWLSAP